jgi:2-dehydro-3-deoxyphosphogluconate aldolase/(4S)-4-hydroxy-2-oxoglutarate aldolase
VVTPGQVDDAVRAGAAFVVSPGLSRPVVQRCLEHGVLPLPGAVTATEIQAALELGLSTVKFFPAESSGGAAAVRALSAPFGGVRFMPTGGIGPANLADYLALLCVPAVSGNWMVEPSRIRAGDWAEVTCRSANAIAAARAALRALIIASLGGVLTVPRVTPARGISPGPCDRPGGRRG